MQLLLMPMEQEACNYNNTSNIMTILAHSTLECKALVSHHMLIVRVRLERPVVTATWYMHLFTTLEHEMYTSVNCDFMAHDSCTG